jgi:hypothetical protein
MEIVTAGSNLGAGKLLMASTAALRPYGFDLSIKATAFLYRLLRCLDMVSVGWQ